jgi:hypothetical protein
LLRDNPEAQDLYLAYMGVQAQLHLDYGSGASPVGMPGGSSMPLGLPPGMDPSGIDGLGSDSPPGADRASWPESPRSLAWAIGGGLAAAALAVALAAVSWSGGRRPAQAPALTKGQKPPRVAPAGGFAIVAKLDDVRWERAGGLQPSEGDVLAEGRLGLRSGRVTLAFLNGVMLTLEGPADLELVSMERVFCHRGKIRTHVPPGAEGFVVSSPGSYVVDLGTEFGLNVEADGRARVMVFEGEADAAVLEPSGSAQRNRNVTEHRALEIDPSRFQLNDTRAISESFVAPPKLTTPPLSVDPSYRDVVLAAHPWGYWRFESLDGGVVPNEVAGRTPLRAFGPVRLADSGAGNRAVAFGPGRSDQYLLTDDRWAPPRDPGYAVELWFSPERIGLAELAGLFVPRGEGNYDHLFQLELTSRNRESILFQRASIRFLHRWPPGYQGGDNLFSDYYVPYRWHHVVAQMRGDQMALYVNGAPLPALPVDPGRLTEACQFILGQLKPLPRGPESWNNRPFVGQIDELALYDRPLSAEEVRRHHALGTPGGRPSGP